MRGTVGLLRLVFIGNNCPWQHWNTLTLYWLYTTCYTLHIHSRFTTSMEINQLHRSILPNTR